jgi:hypothetical protein
MLLGGRAEENDLALARGRSCVRGRRAAVEEGKSAAAAVDNERLGSANQHFHGALVAMPGAGSSEVALPALIRKTDRDH